ncbi:hypothetical protein Dsin_026235 [Dipteronia sinensis]|uniref:RNase H type-1 domain-containing protein n=1 Tax=Dipteronia sinensis TaxID=43782 RepID=A0AAE0DXK9_9ROSI|nr:hypothetical protein Dsin_026235 [Dipteronia sinensis]
MEAAKERCIVIRDGDGVVRVSSAQYLKAVFSPLIAELVAVLRGIRLALDMGLIPVQVETYSLNTVDLVLNGTSPPSDIGTIIGDISVLLASCPTGSVLFVPRQANGVAHRLTKMTVSTSFEGLWVESFPPCVEKLVLEDSPG